MGVWLAIFFLLLLGLGVWFMMGRPNLPVGGEKKPATPAPQPQQKFGLEPESKVMPRYAGAESCRTCHAAEFEKWQGSHHGLAERKVDMKTDGIAFEPAREIKAGTQVSEAKTTDGKLVLTTAGLK